jgi:hypothetical protein
MCLTLAASSSRASLVSRHICMSSTTSGFPPLEESARPGTLGRQGLDELLNCRRSGRSRRSPVQTARQPDRQSALTEGVSTVNQDGRRADKATLLGFLRCSDEHMLNLQGVLPHDFQGSVQPLIRDHPVGASIEVEQLHLHDLDGVR